jgi:hypothetical protein
MSIGRNAVLRDLDGVCGRLSRIRAGHDRFTVWRTEARDLARHADATIGIALFILLPVARVIVMVTAYLRQRDYRLSAIALLVLTVILLGFAVGLAGRRGKTADASMQVPEESVPPDDVHAISRMQDSLPVAAVCTCTPSLFQTTIRVEENRI